VADAHVCEIAAGASLKPEKHLFEELTLILRGKGATEVWNEGGKKNTFEWQEGSLFALPLNACHQYFNGSAGEPVRYLSVTDAPLVLNRFRNLDFVFNCPFNFIDRYDSSPQYFVAQGKEYSDTILKTNFVPDVQTVPLVDDLRVNSRPILEFLNTNRKEIPFDEEDPRVREDFVQALAREGVALEMASRSVWIENTENKLRSRR
jgi:hypothetical protein